MEQNQFLGALGLLLNALDKEPGRGNLFPEEDAQDFLNGATSIPGEVTCARRRGINVKYDPDKKEWEMPNGKIITIK
jgi:hypothetical protein